MRRPSLPTGSRRWIIAAAAVVVVLIVAFSVASSFYIDLLWFRELSFTSVFWTTLRTKVLLGLVFGLLFFALLYANLLIVRRTSPAGPPLRIVSPEQEALDRLRRLAEPYLRWVVPAACALLALLVGINTSSQWSTYLLWRNGQGETFGNPEALFGRDPSFYVFTLPWLHFLQSWVFSSLLGVTVLAGIAHFAWGGIQPTAPAFADKASPLVRGHLSVLLGLTLLARAWGYYLDRFDLLSSTRGVVQGASYTDIRAQLPALNVLTLVAIICALLFLVNIRLRRWSLPVIAVGLLAAVSILLGRAYPAFVQQFSVKPQEAQREQPYIERNIEGTRTAFGLGTIKTVEHPAVPAVTPADIAENRATIDNIRLWRPSVIVKNFQAQERKQPYYEFADIDVDRYNVSGQPRVLLLSGREVSQTGIPGSGNSWQNSHLVYTHGYGAAAALVNSASAEGAPAFTLGNLPPEGEPAISQPQIYYGELNEVPFVVTNTDTPEFDPIAGDTPSTSTGGIELGNRLQRAMFAWRYNDLNLLISGLIDGDSRILLYRQIQARVHKAAPFLTFDADPYLTVVDGKLLWIFDAYTTTTAYPYSQTIDLNTATQGDLSGRANYVRNSVKGTVDAASGEVTFYLVDKKDPIAQTWNKVYPDLFSNEEPSASLQAHFRYPENLFQIQANQYATYHVTDASEFYQKEKVWAIAANPTAEGASQGELPPMRPYYVLMRLPGSDEEHFQLILPFTPVGRENMVSWLAANSDPGFYGEVVNFVFPAGSPVQGPIQVNSLINQEPSFSTFRTQTGQQGSTVDFGDLLVIPVNDALLYVVPAYVVSDQANAIPELKRVLVVNNGVVGVGANLNEALAEATGAEPPAEGGTGAGAGTGTGSGGTGSGAGGTVNSQLSDLLTEALSHFTAADAALKAGDLATYQSELTQAQALVQQANDLMISDGSTTGAGTGTGTDGSSTVPTIASSPPTSAFGSDPSATVVEGNGTTSTTTAGATSTTAPGSGAGTTRG